MKDIRMEVRRARMKKGVRYTALFNTAPGYGLISELDGKRVTIRKIRTLDVGYRVHIVEDKISILPSELSEWKEE